MKRLSVSLMLIALAMIWLTPVSGNAKKTNEPVQRELVGHISDNHCGLKHMSGMGDDKSCTLMCVKNGKFVLADSEHNRVYQLDKAGQEKAREFAGQKVKITGRLYGRTIRVTNIEAAS